jgi:restriction endonuclease Mrr
LRAFRDGDSGQEYVVISAKRYSGPVGVRHVRELSGVVERDKATRGLLVTSSRLTKPAAREIEDQCFRLGAADGKMLLGWVQEIVGQYGLVSARL